METTIKIGPLEFECLLESISEQIGDQISTQGLSVTTTEKKIKSFDLKLLISGDTVEEGKILRRQCRQLFNNRELIQEGLFLEVLDDHDLDCWIVVGQAEIIEGDETGLLYGTWELHLKECYILGTPSTHYRGYQYYNTDYSTGLHPRLSKNTNYSTEYNSYSNQVFLPKGNLVNDKYIGNYDAYEAVDNALGTLFTGIENFRVIYDTENNDFNNIQIFVANWSTISDTIRIYNNDKIIDDYDSLILTDDFTKIIIRKIGFDETIYWYENDVLIATGVLNDETTNYQKINLVKLTNFEAIVEVIKPSGTYRLIINYAQNGFKMEFYATIASYILGAKFTFEDEISSTEVVTGLIYKLFDATDSIWLGKVDSNSDVTINSSTDEVFLDYTSPALNYGFVFKKYHNSSSSYIKANLRYKHNIKYTIVNK